jgi:hypothetical protein
VRRWRCQAVPPRRTSDWCALASVEPLPHGSSRLREERRHRYGMLASCIGSHLLRKKTWPSRASQPRRLAYPNIGPTGGVRDFPL